MDILYTVKNYESEIQLGRARTKNVRGDMLLYVPLFHARNCVKSDLPRRITLL